MKRLITAFLFVLCVGTWTYAHEGHDQKIMGMVTVVSAERVEVKDTKGKVSTITLNEKTKVVMGKMAHTVSDIKVGQRVVVTATDVKDKTGKTGLVAKQVALGTMSAAARTKK